ASAASRAAQLLGRLTSASRAALRAELQLRVQEALNGMDPLDREVLALRHFEMLTNSEVAEVLGVKKSAASNRYVRALERLRDLLSGSPEFEDLALRRVLNPGFCPGSRVSRSGEVAQKPGFEARNRV